jgi:coenzyme F420-reducing hydrogenase alpha subunit
MKTLKLEPLTRVEGHGRVDLVLEDGRLSEVRINLLESPRLFEGLVVGRSFREVPALICRICSICSAVHRIAAAAALERALGVTIPPAARLVRELLLLGGHIESHVLHLYCLVLPDIRRCDSIVDLLRAGSDLARDGLALKALGNRIQELAGGRMIHPINVEVGGVLRLPDAAGLTRLLAELDKWQEMIAGLTAVFAEPASYPTSRQAVGTRLCVAGDAGLTLTGETLRLSDGRLVPGADYRQLLAERPAAHSNAKDSGGPGETFLAGALARLENAGPGAGEIMAGGGIFANNAAQGRELAWALERCRELARQLLALPAAEPVMAPVPVAAGIGTEVIEAPRGLLVHHYVLDDAGRVVAADIVTPTAINQTTMAAQLLVDLTDLTDEAELAASAQCLVRAFDPCISCSVHVVRI